MKFNYWYYYVVDDCVAVSEVPQGCIGQLLTHNSTNDMMKNDSNPSSTPYKQAYSTKHPPQRAYPAVPEACKRVHA